MGSLLRARWTSAFVTIALSATTFAQSAPPPLPHLAVDSYPPTARDAISRAHKAATARPLDPETVCGLARLLHAWEQWEAAHEAYARCEALAPRNFDAHYLDAIVLDRLARRTDVTAAVRQALNADPTYLPARVRLAEALLESGDLVESRRVFESLVKEPAAEPAAQLGLGRIDAAEGHHDRAIAHLQRAIELFPEFGAAYYALALSYRALGRTDEAQRALAQHAQYGPRWPAIDDPVRATVAALRNDAATELQRGIKLADAGDLSGAIEAHEAALARDPSFAQAHENLISLYGRQQNWVKAEEHYHALAALGVNLSDAHYDYGVLLVFQEKWDLAAEAYRRALELNPAHAQARNNLGQILERQRDFKGAADTYRQAVQSQPTFRLARFNLGRMLLALGRTDEAIAELEKITQPRDGETPRYLFALSAAYVRAGRKEEAIRLATDARQLALEYGQKDLAAIIERDLARIK